MKKIILIVLVVFNCGSLITQIDEFYFYPLNEGNVWVYSLYNTQWGTYSKIRKSVSAVQVVNNHKYYKVGDYFFRVDSASGNVYALYTGNGCSWSPNERMVDSLKARISDTVKSDCGSTIKRCLDTNLRSIFNVTRRSRHFIYQGGGTLYVRELGIYEVYGGSGPNLFSQTLLGCVINGVVYGDTSMFTSSISGVVRFQDNNQPVSSGYVKAIKHSSLGGNLIVVDSVRIQPNGSYMLTQIPQDTVDLMAFDDDEAMHSPVFVPTYYPSTIEWQQAVPLYTTSNLININIGVYRISNDLQSSGIISGGVYLNTDMPLYPLKDAVIYAKIGNVFKGYSISSGTGSYSIDYLPQGSYTIVCSRMGYTSSTVNEQLGAGNLNNINFYFGVPLGISETGIPLEFSLLQNYPNPFNPVTNITFEIQKAANVQLKIYDANGKEITVLVNGKHSEGTYTVDWDAENYPSGVYFYQLISEGFTETKKMVLLK